MTFGFINCHLKSGAFKAGSRLKMTADILKSISCNEKDMIEPDAVHDFNFFMGDLNFRFNRTFSEHMPDLARSPQLLRELDQLHEARENGSFPDYEEAQIKFMPTYKRMKHNNDYKNKKEQCPSYTDRIMFKNNTSCPALITEYSCYDDYFGSDHRPVFMKLKLKTQPFNYLDPQTLVNPDTPVQGRGEILLKNVQLNFDDDRIDKLKLANVYPLFLQLHFRSEWLVTKPVSYEKVISSRSEREDKTFHWKDHQIPLLSTPVNSQQILESKCLVIAIQLCEYNQRKTTGECFAYVRLDLSNLQKLKDIQQSKSKSESYFKLFANADVVGFSTLIGEFSCVLHYRIVDK